MALSEEQLKIFAYHLAQVRLEIQAIEIDKPYDVPREIIDDFQQNILNGKNPITEDGKQFVNPDPGLKQLFRQCGIDANNQLIKQDVQKAYFHIFQHGVAISQDGTKVQIDPKFLIQVENHINAQHEIEIGRENNINNNEQAQREEIANRVSNVLAEIEYQFQVDHGSLKTKDKMDIVQTITKELERIYNIGRNIDRNVTMMSINELNNMLDILQRQYNQEREVEKAQRQIELAEMKRRYDLEQMAIKRREEQRKIWKKESKTTEKRTRLFVEAFNQKKQKPDPQYVIQPHDTALVQLKDYNLLPTLKDYNLLPTNQNNDIQQQELRTPDQSALISLEDLEDDITPMSPTNNAQQKSIYQSQNYNLYQNSQSSDIRGQDFNPAFRRKYSNTRQRSGSRSRSNSNSSLSSSSYLI